jgi:hypothetical protein
MQNRNMFLYRRQGPNKKRTKSGPPRKNKGPQKGLPNSARDLLPLIQPATKALAQMLAGHTGASGQLGHARAVLAQTEKLVSDRAHNRLNPAEREEFFEQVARLRLTLADAESEAEVQTSVQEPAPVAAPVDRERLKEMALALTSPGGSTSYEDRHKSSNAASKTPEEPADLPNDSDDDDSGEPEPALEMEPPRELANPNQLRLPRKGAEQLKVKADAPRRAAANGKKRLAKPDAPSPRTTTLKVPPKAAPQPTSVVEASDSEQPAQKVAPSKPTSATLGQKLPKGWIIDDEGFVVPGPAA